MLKVNEKTILYNLEEQVLENQRRIAEHYAIDRALANLGITIVGQVTFKEDLPDPISYQGVYGDTYAVGDKIQVDLGQATYEYYVYTRPDPNAGEFNNYWLNVGKISIAGPQGVQGPMGPQGKPGEVKSWYVGRGAPLLSTEYTVGDIYLNSINGTVYKLYENNGELIWIAEASLKGPQGIQGPQGIPGPQGVQGAQGPQGERGDVGGFINIVGIVSSPSELPLPASIRNLTHAYLVGNKLYIQVGENSDEATWHDAGPFNAATLVTENGVGQNVWEANSKLTKQTGVTENSQVYGKAANGAQLMVNTSETDLANSLVVRDSSGYINTDKVAVSNNNVLNLETANSKYLSKPSFSTDTLLKYQASNGQLVSQSTYTSTPISGAVPITGTNGTLKVGTPIEDTDAATKGYVKGIFTLSGSTLTITTE